MKKLLITKLIISFMLIVPVSKSLAQEVLQQSKKKIALNLLLDTSSTLARQAANSAGEELSFSGLYRLDLGVPLSRTLTAKLRTGYSQEYSYVLPDNTTGDLIDSRLGLALALGEVRKDLSLALSSNLTLPTSRDSQRAGLKSAAGLAINAEKKLGRISIGLTPGWTEYFHDVISQNDGTINISRSASLLLEASYEISPLWTASASIQPNYSWTYTGTTRSGYFIAYDLTYEWSKKAFLSLGIYNKASALKSNGLDYNYALYDQSQFMGYFDILLKL